MNCEKCGTPMIIDEWGGWVWTCYHCDHVGRTATNEEVKRHEKEFGRLHGQTTPDETKENL
jgi:ribosomal protein L37AE/L43A